MQSSTQPDLESECYLLLVVISLMLL